MVHRVQSVAVVGSGLMGTGIAEACAVAGLKTVLVKVTPGDPEPARERVLGSMAKAVAQNKLSRQAADRAGTLLEATRQLERVATADLVIETATENLLAKQELLRRLSDHVQPGTVIGSNTSSLRLSTLAEAVQKPSLFLGLHFFSPANVMKLVEVGSTAKTSREAVELALGFCTAIGKTPIELGDHPGYVVNRLLVPYVLHAIETLEQGVASPEAIDTAMKLGCGHPVGPLALADRIGLDVVFAMSRSLHQELRDNRYRCPPLLRRLVMSGALGRKSGVGFYRYGGEAPVPNSAVFEFDRPSAPGAAAPAA